MHHRRLYRARKAVGVIIVILMVRILLETSSRYKSSEDPKSLDVATHETKKQIPTNKATKPIHLSNRGGGFQKRYADSPFRKQMGGGPLPLDTADFLQSETMWKYLNDTCIEEGHIAEWQYRVPYVILLGAMKCGTHALTESLWEHPLVARNRYWELHFFDSDKPVRTEKGIQAHQTRTAYISAFRRHSPEFFAQLDNNGTLNDKKKMIVMESSPRYILNSDRIPQLILCTVPWVKFLLLVRDPVDRAESQFRYLYESRLATGKPMVDWQRWIDDDLRLLQEAGVLQAKTRDEERLAWKRYQRRPNSDMIVGRGIYVLQLLDYFEIMDQYNKSRSDMLVVQSERFRRHQQSDYNNVLQFLGLPPHTLQNVTGSVHATHHKEEAVTAMPGSIKEQLKHLYRPYNKRLYALLKWRMDLRWDETQGART
ncbi:TPR domain protein [Nitzschia inconspicua]|uniref:TPR domain protein n=1 Tax=Nitzschia inconspicua TaxID=303405 RepID=A0A9K3LZS6_9STRA|nr:TPR domain protein [Nitzschia inconspicua]